MTRRKAPRLRGTVTRRGNRWRIRFDSGVDPITGTRVRISESFDSEDAARDRLVELNAARGKRPTTRAKTVGDALDRFLDLGPSAYNWSPRTLDGYRSKVETYLRPAFGDTPLRDLETADVDALYARLRRKGGTRGLVDRDDNGKATPRGVAVSTIRQTNAVLRGALDVAVRYGWATDNVAESATIPRAAKASEHVARRGVLDVDQIAAVWAEGSPELRFAIVLGMATGRRLGQLCGLRWKDVDLDAGTITFRRTVAELTGGAVEVVEDDRQKSDIGEVPIDDDAVDALKAQRRKARKTALAFGVKLRDDAYVLSEEPGGRTPLRPNRVSGRWKNAARRAGVPFRFHDLRHFHVSALLDAGVDPATVADLVGHANAQVTLTVYAHRLRKRDRRSVDALRPHAVAFAAAVGR